MYLYFFIRKRDLKTKKIIFLIKQSKEFTRDRKCEKDSTGKKAERNEDNWQINKKKEQKKAR